MAGTLPDLIMMHADSLIAQAKQGDQHAQGKLVQLWYKRIYNYAFKFFFDHDLAMEIAQRTFISMCRNIHNLQDNSRFKAWIYKITVNYCREEARKQQHNRSLSLDMLMNPDMENAPAWELTHHRSDSPEKVFRHNELAEILQQALEELNEDQREVVIMKEFEGLKFREIAEILNVSENTIKSRMYYGLDTLKKILLKKNFNKDSLGYEI